LLLLAHISYLVEDIGRTVHWQCETVSLHTGEEGGNYFVQSSSVRVTDDDHISHDMAGYSYNFELLGT
jgi:hypothetical protein